MFFSLLVVILDKIEHGWQSLVSEFTCKHCYVSEAPSLPSPLFTNSSSFRFIAKTACLYVQICISNSS